MAEKQIIRKTSSPGACRLDIHEQPLQIANAISLISTRLARTGDLNTHLDDSLAQLGALVGADRAYVFQFRESGALMDNTHEWCAEGVMPQITELQGLHSQTFDWFVAKVRQGKAFQISDVSALPPEAESERSILEAQGIRSLLIMPMGPAGRPTGFVGFDNVREADAWRPEDIHLLRIVSRLTGDALERQRSHQALALSVQRQKAILENIPDIAWLKDEDSRFVHVNEPFARSCGIPAGELIGKTDLAIWPQELAARYRQDDAEVMRTRQRKRVEEPLADKDLGERVIETIKTPVFDSYGRVIGTTGIARDITERKQAEQAIRESEERYRRLVESLPAIVYRYSHSKGASYWSPQVEDILGFSPQDLHEKPFLWHDAIHPDDLPMVDKAIAAFEVGNRVDLNYRIRDVNGVWHWFHDRYIGRLDVEGEVVIEGLAFDITAQQRAEQALRESDSRFRQIAGNINVVLWMMTPDLDQIVYISPVYEQIWGQTCQSLYDNPDSWTDAIHSEDKELIVAACKEMGRVGFFEQEYRIVKPNGSVHWVRDHGFPIKDEAGNIYRIAGFVEEITERKNNEVVLQEKTA